MTRVRERITACWQRMLPTPTIVYPAGGRRIAGAALALAGVAIFFFARPEVLSQTVAGERLSDNFDSVWNGCFLVGGITTAIGVAAHRRWRWLYGPVAEGIGLTISSVASGVYAVAGLEVANGQAAYLVVLALIVVLIFTWRAIRLYSYAIGRASDVP